MVYVFLFPGQIHSDRSSNYNIGFRLPDKRTTLVYLKAMNAIPQERKCVDSMRPVQNSYGFIL